MRRAPRREETESRTVARCAALYAAVGAKVYFLQQRRPSGQSSGLPDLQVVFRGKAVIFHEAKTPDALRRPRCGMSEDQAELRELLAGISGVRHVLGGFDEAWQALQDLGYVVQGATSVAPIDALP